MLDEIENRKTFWVSWSAPMSIELRSLARALNVELKKGTDLRVPRVHEKFGREWSINRTEKMVSVKKL